jgi:aspartate-semialdehyde dehydrogenase
VSGPVAAPARRIPVAVLGATGAVGQAFIRLLADHPWFDLVAVAASERSAGRPYGEAARWMGEERLPSRVAGLTVQPCTPDRVEAAIVFSALDSGVAGEVEAAFAGAGRLVLSNARNYRMEPDVPLVLAEVNAPHLEILDAQRRRRGWSGGIVTNGNCATIVAAMALAPVHERYGLRRVFAATMQAVSGAGYPGVPSLDILGNVIPYISGEEDKIETELQKFLGTVDGDSIRHADIGVTAHANRVAVEHGHTACLSIELVRKAAAEEVAQCIADWRGAPAARGLPSSPAVPVVVMDQPDRPQPRRDANLGGGMSVAVGRVRPDPLLDVKLVAMGHNIVRGAAGASVQNAELLVRLGAVPETA